MCRHLHDEKLMQNNITMNSDWETVYKTTLP